MPGTTRVLPTAAAEPVTTIPSSACAGREVGSLTWRELDRLGIDCREVPGSSSGDFDLAYIDPTGEPLSWWQPVPEWFVAPSPATPGRRAGRRCER